MRLSKHFLLSEFARSQLAARHGIDNTPPPEVVANLTELCVNVLEPIRAHFKRPITINSGYRCLELNTLLGSSIRSQHTKGEAADIEIAGLSNKDLAVWVCYNKDFDQLILEGWKDNGDPNAGWVHCSYVSKGTNRRDVLTAEFVDGKANYTKGLPE